MELPELPKITVNGPELFCRLAGTPIIPGYPFGRVPCDKLCGGNDCTYGQGKHRLSQYRRAADRPIGLVWFSQANLQWLRQTGRARWNTEAIATDEDIFYQHGRRYRAVTGMNPQP